MRHWVVIITLASLLLLPFSGNSTSMPSAQMTAPAHHTMQDAAAETQDAHCEMMAAKLAEIRQQRQATSSPVMNDCCEDPADCFLECSSDCGHCVMSGHGCSAATSAVIGQRPLVAHDRAFSKTSRYSLLLAKVSPPPIIS
ncbi:hypothetical protein [Aliidiomarina sanyensis]|uniref:Uncharacterized protein n=1 Tax=Aliidiomarina sanyensis TaxID=1249555 RepID=A0A432WPR5_9GAMM|nr:hypothetical protein [Aliidiomarina sanyensis]RUO35765.1 hypothetical protein CWE11_03130 [Aliidiomarina sanyensis]